MLYRKEKKYSNTQRFNSYFILYSLYFVFLMTGVKSKKKTTNSSKFNPSQFGYN